MNKIHVEQCHNGTLFYFRLTFNGNRETVVADSWNRKVATQAKNLFQNVYGLNRHNIVFLHR